MPKRMIYNLALEFSEDLGEEIQKFATVFQAVNDCEFRFDEKAIPHATLIKFEAESDPFVEVAKGKYEVVLSGLNLLPSRKQEENSGTWVEILVLLPQELRRELDEIARQLEPGGLRSEVGDMLRPHITVCKLKTQNNVEIQNLDAKLLRKNEVNAEMKVGLASKAGFTFSNL